MRISDIEWAFDDADEQEAMKELPETVILKGEFERDVIDDDIANELSDKYGWLVSSFFVESRVVKVRDVLENGHVMWHCDNPVLEREFDLYDYESLEECCKECIQPIESDELYCDAEYNLIGLWRTERGFTDEDAEYAADLGYEGCWFMDHYLTQEELKSMSDNQLEDELADTIDAREGFAEDDTSWEPTALDELYLLIDNEIQRRRAIA